jgi:predicted PurR-regulated permease PerM
MGGQAFLCVLIGTTAGLGFWLIGLPYFYVLALICGVGELVPIVGPVMAAVPAIIVASTMGANTALITAAYLFVQQQVENNIIIPRLMKSQTGVSPLIVMVAILIGGELLGVIGALLAVPTAAVIQILIRDYLDSRESA